MDLRKSTLIREPGESGRSFLSRRLTELRNLEKRIPKVNQTEEEQDAYFYCLGMIPVIESDLNFKTDEVLDREVNWELGGKMGKCPLIVDNLPTETDPEPKTRYERGLETLPCQYYDCPEYGTKLCWAWQTDKEPVCVDYGDYPIE